MDDVIIVTGCTGRMGLIDAYEQQLFSAGIAYVIDNTPYATSSFNMLKRISYWREIAERYIQYKMIVITDAWDVLFFGTKEDLLTKFKDGVLISAERNCFPGPEFGYKDLTNVITGDTPWRYSNPGMVAANPGHLLGWLDAAERTLDLTNSDQAWCNYRLHDSPGFVQLDTRTRLFYVISYSDGRLEDGALKIKDGRLWNSTCDTYPNFFHFAGHGPHEARRVLPSPVPPRYETMNTIRSYIAGMR